MTENIERSASIFSFRRWNMLWQYFIPQLKRQLICYTVASLIFAGCILLPLSGPEQVLIFVAISLAADIMFGFAPIVFAKFGDSRIIDRLIPASPLEKTLFYYVYLLILIPLIIKVPYFVAISLYFHLASIQTIEMTAVMEGVWSTLGSTDHITYITNITGNMTVLVSCLYFVLTSRHNRVLKGVAGGFGAYIILSILGGIIGYMKLASLLAITGPEKYSMMLMEISPAMVVLVCAEWVYMAVMTVLIYRWLKKGAL